MNKICCSIYPVLVLLALIPSPTVAEWDAFIGKFNQLLIGGSGFYNLPTTKFMALISFPRYVDYGQDPDFAVNVFCLENDPHVCILFDTNGNVAGIRISRLKHEVADNLNEFPYKYDSIPIFKSGKMFGKEFWYANFLFTDPDNLKRSGQGKTDAKVTAEGLWVHLSSGWTEIPRDECDAQKAGWNKQGFIPWMGNHYTMGNTDECSTFLPLLPLYHRGRLIGLALATFGKYSVVERDWFEDVPCLSIPFIVPNGFQPCLWNWTSKYKNSAFHFYFTKYPRTILLDQSPSLWKCNANEK